MILVNNQVGDDIYYHLDHARWNDWTMADLIFPFFLFIVGAVIPFSVANRLDKGQSKRELLYHIIKRTLIIVGLGLFINAFPYFSLSSLRIPGVLQRIGICYFFASLIMLKSGIRAQALISAGLLIFYWLIMKLVPVPGYDTVILEPGKNLAAYIDNFFMHGHMFEPTWDPEGLLSTVPALSTTLLGALTGHVLRLSKSPAGKTFLLLIYGSAGVISGLTADVWFPINKYIWSSSYVLFTAGAAAVLLGFIYWIVDVINVRRWSKVFVMFGANALGVYVLSTLLEKLLWEWGTTLADGSRIKMNAYLLRNIFASWSSPVNASLIYSLTVLLIWLGLAAILYRKKIFIKI
ncbi:MAG: DUF5009 domain-containing protein [Nitrospiraceae bacterium]|nr:MAG: DUF5009 domain-containing protein [Nitrospiraceae bacterium]